MDNHLFIDEIHQYHVCQHPSCISNRAFERIQREKGDYYLAKRIMRREPYRLYDRKYPYDSTTKAIPVEEIQDTLGDDPQYLDGIIASESVMAFKQTLTPKQRAITELLEMGHEPRHIAEQWGLKDSNSVRWHKHMIKRRAEEFYKDDCTP